LCALRLRSSTQANDADKRNNNGNE
jgi:hypothetical protein